MRKLMLVLVAVVILMCNASTTLTASAADANRYAVECISIIDSQVCVGESHDSVIAKIDTAHSTGQTVLRNSYGPVVKRDYDYLGKRFSITFGRTSADGPHRVVAIKTDRRNAGLGSGNNLVPYDPILTNLADPSGKRYIKIELVAETDSQENAEQLRLEEQKAKDTIIIALANKTYAEVATREGKISLKKDLCAAINGSLGRPLVKEIYIIDIVIQ